MDHVQASRVITLIRGFYGTMNERQAALWDHCCAVVDSLPNLVPDVPPDFPPVLDRRTTVDIQSALNIAVGAEADGLSRLVASAFSRYRHEVLNAEATSAGRLTVVVGALQRLYELAETAEHEEPRALVLEMVEFIEAHVRDVWRTAFPRSASVRDWPVVVTRRYDLLPVPWRYLGAVESRERLRKFRPDQQVA